MAVLKLEASATRCRSDLPRSLKDFYPIARAMGRRITFISGPTNSGKTYQALQQLSRAPSGAYLGPLRLLALEIYDKLTGEGVQTSLITGELVQIAPGATHIAATIEMLDVTAPIDTVVIDEVQMLSDRERGPAWLHAVLGAPAKHVILVGAPSALPAVRQLAALTQEPLTEVSLERLNPLNVMERPVGLKDLPKGSALIVFSRQAALSFANHLREQHHRKVSVVYGALSPEVRKEQARLFREGLTDIVVATDAIGMGLNLPIQTLIFSTSVKWDGKAEVQLEHALTWQISGRAGRYGLHESGEVGGLDPATLKHIRSMLAEQPPPLRPPFFYGLTLPIAIAIARQLGTERLGLILTFFADRLHLEEWALSRVSEDQNALAELLDSHELSLETRLTLSHAPARHARVLNPLFKTFLKTLADGEAQVIPKTRQYSLLGGALHLENMESQVRDLTLYSWMHYRWPELFPQIEESQSRLLVLNDTITQALAKEPGRRCKECAKPMPWNAAYGICEDCFSERKRYRDAVYA